MNRVAVTGAGCITATGHDLDTVWNAIKAQQSGIDKVTSWNIQDWQYTLAGEIKNIQPAAMLPDRKLVKMISKHDCYGIYAANQAIQQSGLLTYRDTLAIADTNNFNDRTGVYVGSPGNKFDQQYDFLPLIKDSMSSMDPFAEQLNQVVHPMWLLRNLPNNVLAYTGIYNGFKGANENVTNHVVSGIQALLEAYYAIKRGLIDRAVVVSYDFGADPQTYLYYGGMGVLSNTGIRSFSADRDGTILAEGAGAIVLERWEKAEERGAAISGEILGGVTTQEAQGLFAIDIDGSGVEAALKQTLQQTGLAASQIGLVTAHANGTKNSDASEAAAIRRVFGENTVPVTGYKWSFGHTLCGAGLIETLLTLRSLTEKTAPGIATLKTVASECQGINISQDNQGISSDTALIVNRGFGSLNVCLALKAIGQ